MESVIQGDSISRDVTSTTVTDFTDWTGLWAIFTTIGGTAIQEGSLTMSVDKTRMECRVPPYEHDAVDVIPIGTVYLEIQVENTDLAFRRTLPIEKIKITAQGIV